METAEAQPPQADCSSDGDPEPAPPLNQQLQKRFSCWELGQRHTEICRAAVGIGQVHPDGLSGTQGGQHFGEGCGIGRGRSIQRGNDVAYLTALSAGLAATTE